MTKRYKLQGVPAPRQLPAKNSNIVVISRCRPGGHDKTFLQANYEVYLSHPMSEIASSLHAAGDVKTLQWLRDVGIYTHSSVAPPPRPPSPKSLPPGPARLLGASKALARGLTLEEIEPLSGNLTPLLKSYVEACSSAGDGRRGGGGVEEQEVGGRRLEIARRRTTLRLLLRCHLSNSMSLTPPCSPIPSQILLVSLIRSTPTSLSAPP